MKSIRNIIKEEIDKLFEDQIREYNSFKYNNKDKEYIPTEEISKTALLAKNIYSKLDEKSKIKSPDAEGNLGSGIRIADKLINKTPISLPSLNKLNMFFERNMQNVQQERKANGVLSHFSGTEQEMTKSPLLLMWNLHGGDKCYNWVKQQIKKNHDSDGGSKKLRQKVGGAPEGKGPGIFDISMTDPTKQRIHR